MDWYAFKRQMGPRYVSFHEALASGDQHTLRSLMTEPGFTVRLCLHLVSMRFCWDLITTTQALKNAVSLDRAKKMKVYIILSAFQMNLIVCKFVWKIESLQAPKIVSYGLLGGQIPGAGWTVRQTQTFTLVTTLRWLVGICTDSGADEKQAVVRSVRQVRRAGFRCVYLWFLLIRGFLFGSVIHLRLKKNG